MRCFQLWMISKEKIALMDGIFTKCKIRLMRPFLNLKNRITYVRDLVYLFPTYNFLCLLNQVFDRKWVLEVLRGAFHTWVKNHDWLNSSWNVNMIYFYPTNNLHFLYILNQGFDQSWYFRSWYLICLTVFW